MSESIGMSISGAAHCRAPRAAPAYPALRVEVLDQSRSESVCRRKIQTDRIRRGDARIHPDGSGDR